MVKTERQLPLLMVVRRTISTGGIPAIEDLKGMKVLGKAEEPVPVFIDATRHRKKRRTHVTLVKDKVFRMLPRFDAPKR
ncbi:MAG: hypothetical protein ACHQT7_01060 [Candidatus Levyibacteriota bacterium]